MKISTILLFTALAVLLAACSFDVNVNTPPTATTGPTSAVVTATASSPFPWPDEAGTCTMLTTDAVTLYDRPSTEAEIFSEVGADISAVVIGRTADGWVGFDPGIAQAANIGVFRMRWAHFDTVSLTGSCVDVPQLTWVPQPTLCYTMPMESVNVYTGVNTSASVLATLEKEQFASVSGYTGDGWAQVDLGAGNTGTTGIGWMEQAALNLNGGLCDELPTVSP
jgi:hypothetical protein